MKEHTHPFTLLAPALGQPVGAMLTGYRRPGGRVELVCNGRREVVGADTVTMFVAPVVKEVVEVAVSARAEEYQEAVE